MPTDRVQPPPSMFRSAAAMQALWGWGGVHRELSLETPFLVWESSPQIGILDPVLSQWGCLVQLRGGRMCKGPGAQMNWVQEHSIKKPETCYREAGEQAYEWRDRS